MGHIGFLQQAYFDPSTLSTISPDVQHLQSHLIFFIATESKLLGDFTKDILKVYDYLALTRKFLIVVYYSFRVLFLLHNSVNYQ